jgi:phytoene desaturase
MQLALYAVITDMDSIEGVWFLVGGMHSVSLAIAGATEKAAFRYGDETEAVLRSPTGRVAGARAQHHADARPLH